MHRLDVVSLAAPAGPGPQSVPLSLGGLTPNACVVLASLPVADGQPATDHAVFAWGAAGAPTGVAPFNQWAAVLTARDNVTPTETQRLGDPAAVLRVIDATGAALLTASVTGNGPNAIELTFTATVVGVLVTVIGIVADDATAGVSVAMGAQNTATPVVAGFQPRYIVTGGLGSNPWDGIVATLATGCMGAAARVGEAGIAQGAAAYTSTNGVAASDAIARVDNNRVVSQGGGVPARLELTSWDAAGFSMTKRDNATDVTFGWLAIGCPDQATVRVGSVSAGDGAKPFTGVGFRPRSIVRLLTTATVVNVNVTGMSLSVGASEAPGAGRCVAISDQGTANPANTKCLTDAALVSVLNAATGADLRVSQLTSFDADGWTETYAGGDGSGRFGLALLVGAPLISNPLKGRRIAYGSERLRRLRRRVA